MTRIITLRILTCPFHLILLYHLLSLQINKFPLIWLHCCCLYCFFHCFLPHCHSLAYRRNKGYYIHFWSYILANNQLQKLQNLIVVTPVTIGAPPVVPERPTYQQNSHTKLKSQPHVTPSLDHNLSYDWRHFLFSVKVQTLAILLSILKSLILNLSSYTSQLDGRVSSFHSVIPYY